MATANDLLEQWVAGFNQSRWDALSALFAPGGVTEEIGTGRTVGVEQAVQIAKDWRAAFPDSSGDLQNRIVSGNQAAGEILWQGTNTGPLMGMLPTNRRVQVRAVAVVTEEGGKISRVRHYLDVAGLNAQLGLVTGPAPEPSPDPNNFP